MRVKVVSGQAAELETVDSESKDGDEFSFKGSDTSTNKRSDTFVSVTIEVPDDYCTPEDLLDTASSTIERLKGKCQSD